MWVSKVLKNMFSKQNLDKKVVNSLYIKCFEFIHKIQRMYKNNYA